MISCLHDDHGDSPDVAPGPVTRHLLKWHAGDPKAIAEVTAAIYKELHRLASVTVRRQGGPNTIDTSDLLHEFYLELLAATRIDAKSRAQFFGLAARTMRNILVDHARKRNASKRGGAVKITLRDVPAVSAPLDVLEVHQVLERFSQDYPRQAELVELRFFGGLSAEESVLALRNAGYECSLRTVERDWRFARAWLQNALR